MSYINDTKKECNGNANGYIYALVIVNKKDACIDMVSYSDNKEYFIFLANIISFGKSLYFLCNWQRIIK